MYSGKRSQERSVDPISINESLDSDFRRSKLAGFRNITADRTIRKSIDRNVSERKSVGHLSNVETL